MNFIGRSVPAGSVGKVSLLSCQIRKKKVKSNVQNVVYRILGQNQSSMHYNAFAAPKSREVLALFRFCDSAGTMRASVVFINWHNSWRQKVVKVLVVTLIVWDRGIIHCAKTGSVQSCKLVSELHKMHNGENRAVRFRMLNLKHKIFRIYCNSESRLRTKKFGFFMISNRKTPCDRQTLTVYWSSLIV